MDVPLNFSHKPFQNSLIISNTSVLRRTHGITLIEIIVTLAISTIIFTFAVPEVRTLFKLNENAVTINMLVSDLAYSRSESVKRMRDVVICKSSDNLTCDNKSSWQDGWIIFVDEVDQDKQRSLDEPLLKVQQALENNIKITFTSFNSKNRVVYRPSGIADYSNGTFRFCTNNEQYHKDLILSRPGATYLKVNPGPIFRPSKYC